MLDQLFSHFGKLVGDYSVCDFKVIFTLLDHPLPNINQKTFYETLHGIFHYSKLLKLGLCTVHIISYICLPVSLCAQEVSEDTQLVHDRITNRHLLQIILDTCDASTTPYGTANGVGQLGNNNRQSFIPRNLDYIVS